MAIGIFGLIPSSSPDELRKVLQALSTKWGDVVEDLESLEVKPMKGAMTNEVFMVSWPRKETNLRCRKLLVRIYGEGVELFFNRDDEIRTFEYVARHGHGPTLLGRFAGGRVEEFIHARTLSAPDLRDPNISALVASKLRKFHSINIPGDRTVLIWDRMRTWVGQAKNLCSTEHSKEFGLDNIEDEINLLEQEVNQQEIGFCHNDLQYGNIMIDEDTNAIAIIDYEYASCNPIAYDIANHFCEMMANYHSETPHILSYTLYPGEEERRRFICNYLTSSGEEAREQDISQLLEDTEKYTLASHLFWGLWGIISGYVNKIEFNYIEYSRQRFKQYWLRKPQLLSFYSSPE
ncbi:putative choline kinase 3 [Cardamine amara subsp. amara]|uniref:Choline kinase 3 n=1 Tax=Cardamine amara subsp. amara TaxID=228776 RepID=A0ABD1AB24_CARAN